LVWYLEVWFGSFVYANLYFKIVAVMTPGLMMILQIFFGYNRTWSVTIFTIALFLNGAVTAGYLGNGLDIAPNFSGTIFGLANTLSSFGGFLSTYMVGALTYNNVSIKSFSWRSDLFSDRRLNCLIANLIKYLKFKVYYFNYTAFVENLKKLNFEFEI
jgi:hypothetical protein